MAIESGLERVGEYPLDEGVVAFEFFIVTVPLRMHFVDVLAIWSRGYLIAIKKDV